MVVSRLYQAEETLDEIVMHLRNVKQMHRLCKVFKKLSMLPPHANVFLKILVEQYQFRQELLVDRLRAVLRQN